MSETPTPPTPFIARADLDGGEPPASPRGPLADALIAGARAVLAVLLAAALGGMVWLILMQRGLDQGWTDHSFNAAMGLLAGAEEEQISRQGFYLTMLAWLGIAVVFDLVSRVWRADWRVRGLAAAGLVLLLWGLVFGPAVAGRVEEVPAGLFGTDAGGGTVVVALVAALVAGITLSRVHALVGDVAWWEPKHFDLRESLEELFNRDVVAPEPATLHSDDATTGSPRPPLSGPPPAGRT
jgi:MFS family permease